MFNAAIIHSQPLYRKSLALLLSQGIDGLTLVASTADLRSLIHQYRKETIDIIVWDIPSHHVLSPGTRLLKECFPLAKIVVLVASKNTAYTGLLKTLGADIVISSDCELSTLYETINKAHQTYAPPPSSNHVQEPENAVNSPKLERMETAVLELLNQGLSTAQIADQLKVTRNGIARLRHSLKNKLAAGNLSKLLDNAKKLGLLKSENIKRDHEFL